MGHLISAEIAEHNSDDLKAAIHVSSVSDNCRGMPLIEGVQALEQSTEGDKGIEASLDRILSRLPESARVAYMQGQTEGLKEWDAFQKEQQKPLILQKLPKVKHRWQSIVATCASVLLVL